MVLILVDVIAPTATLTDWRHHFPHEIAVKKTWTGPEIIMEWPEVELVYL